RRPDARAPDHERARRDQQQDRDGHERHDEGDTSLVGALPPACTGGRHGVLRGQKFMSERLRMATSVSPVETTGVVIFGLGFVRFAVIVMRTLATQGRWLAFSCGGTPPGMISTGGLLLSK